MDDFFSVPLGTVPPNEPQVSVGISPVPAEAAKYRGKWLALSSGKIIAVRDTEAELRKEFGAHHLGTTFFHVPASSVILR
jgi:hypothetical protein